MQVDRMASSNGLSEAEIQMNLKALKKVNFSWHQTMHKDSWDFSFDIVSNLILIFTLPPPSLTRASKQ